jgi:hypothetical protein
MVPQNAQPVQPMKVTFSDFFGISADIVEQYGAFDISLLADLPLFVDPFLLFNSPKPEYQKLHDQMIEYLSFLRSKSESQQLDTGLIDAWFRFPEVSQNWLGFSVSGNKGRGLGREFANSLHTNLGKLFSSFGKERITTGSHIEKLCLIREGIGRDNISDFTNNLILDFLLEYTQTFAKANITPALRRTVTVPKVRFNYTTESWERVAFDLPFLLGDYVLLTPKDLLTKDETWINKTDFVTQFESIPEAIPNQALRAQINNYFRKQLPKNPKKKDEHRAATLTMLEFPELIDYFIKFKEDHGDEATSISRKKVSFSEFLYLQQFKSLPELLQKETAFYSTPTDTYEQAMQRVVFLKDVIENKGGHRIFYYHGTPIERETDLHILYRMTWFATDADVSREVNDGRGPVDYKISRGTDKTLVEFKLAKNSQLKRNLEKQAEIYTKASDATGTIKVIMYFSAEEHERVLAILKDLKLTGHRNIVLIDARNDNKPSGSKA